jgi:hypothetical protein
MKFVAAIGLTCLLAACNGSGDSRLAALRIHELEDSLKAYRDSLRDVQGVWSFNTLTAVVKLQNHELQLGDSCRAEVFIGAANSPDAARLRYRFGEARLVVEGRPEARISRSGTNWVIAFKPNRVGEDSLLGNIIVDGFGHPVDLSFGSMYEVVMPQDGPFAP